MWWSVLGEAGAAEVAGEYTAVEGGEPTPVSLSSAIGTVSYRPGRGLRVGETRVTLGGYANLNLLRDEGGPAQLTMDDVGLFVIWDPIPRFHLFSELEVEDVVEVDDHGRGGTVNSLFTAERLYGDLTVSDEVTVRVGKFLTPVGRWNVIHAQPLVWTTSRPLATLLPFDHHTTGAMLFGSLLPGTGGVTYSLYGQFANEFEPLDEPRRAERSAGSRVEYARGQGWALGASYLAFSERGNWRHLGGVDTLWQRSPLELMGEVVVEDGPGASGLWGGYLQGVIEVMARFYLVCRYEHFDQRAPQTEVNLVATGIAYKPIPHAILKAEYLTADHRAPEAAPGFKSSFAILF